MKVIVTGTAGHLGSELTKQLLGAGNQVIGVDNLSYGGEAMLTFFSHPHFSFEKIQLREGFLSNIENVDFVIHLAAMVGPLCDESKDVAWETNLEATARICHWVKENNSRLIFASTCSNYGITEGLATETSPLKPISTYAETKVAAEELVSELGDRGVTLRFGTLAGLSPRPRFDTLLNQLVYEALSQGKIEVYQPTAWRPFTHVSDAARAAVQVVEAWTKVNHQRYNVVGFNTTKGELAQEIKARTGCEVVEFDVSSDRRDYAVSDDLIRTELGFCPRLSLADCVEEIFTALNIGVLTPHKAHFNSLEAAETIVAPPIG